MPGTSKRLTSSGAYGLRLSGLASTEWYVEVPEEWTHVTIGRSVGPVRLDSELMNDRRARLRLRRERGVLLADRTRALARYITTRPLRDEELVHPYLSPLAIVWSRWLRRETFHSGAFVFNGGVWAVAGERGAGKSSTLAWLSMMDVPVYCDDVLVVDESKAFAGPRSIDLRSDAANRLGAGEPLGVVGTRERWRVSLGDVEPELPLRGWIFLTWGTVPAIRDVKPRERLVHMGENRSLRLPPLDPTHLLRLAALPAWQLTRPPTWESMPITASLILNTVS